MEEEKAAAYYDELTRKGEGAARFKQGLGFSSSSSNNNDAVPTRGSAFPSSSSSFLSTFVRSSSPSKASELQKHAQLESIQNKLKKKPNISENQKQNQSSSRVSKDRSRDRDNDRHSRQRSRSRSRDDHRSRHRHRHRSRSRDKDEDRDRERERRKRRRSRSRTRSISDEERGRRGRGRSRSVSPRDRRLEKTRSDEGKVRKERNGGIDHAKLIEGYDNMSPAERVKAKMKLQLSETAEKDATKGMGSGWERFNFDKDAPLDNEEIEAADDDAELVKHIGQTFRFSAVEARREEKIKLTHDEAIFGTSSHPPPVDTDSEVEGDNYKSESTQSAPVASLISDQVRAMQQGSWRDRARKV